MYHVRNRVLDPRDGRWLQRDPIGYPGGWNLYQYANSDPFRFVDPDGLTAEPMGFWGTFFTEVGKGLWNTATTPVVAAYTVAKEPCVLVANATGLIDPQTAVNNSVLMGLIAAADTAGNGNLAAGATALAGQAVESMGETISLAAQGDLTAIGDVATAIGSAAMGGAVGSKILTHAQKACKRLQPPASATAAQATAPLAATAPAAAQGAHHVVTAAGTFTTVTVTIAPPAVSTAAKVVGHHAIPKFLGGLQKQTLARIPESVHKEFHALLAKKLKEAGFARPIGGRTGSTLQWAKQFANNPGSQRRALDAVLEASREIDAAHGTNITHHVWLNCLEGNFKVHP